MEEKEEEWVAMRERERLLLVDHWGQMPRLAIARDMAGQQPPLPLPHPGLLRLQVAGASWMTTRKQTRGVKGRPRPRWTRSTAKLALAA